MNKLSMAIELLDRHPACPSEKPGSSSGVGTNCSQKWLMSQRKTKPNNKKIPKETDKLFCQADPRETSFQITELVIWLILDTYKKCIKQTPKSFSRTSLERIHQCSVSCLYLLPISAALSEDKTKASLPFLSPK